MKRLRDPLILIGVILSLIAGACSTTSKLEEGEVLYTGVKKMEVVTKEKGEKVPDGVMSQIKSAINARPNNSIPFLSPYTYSRYPFPLGLWVYNHISDSAKGLKGWIYRNFAKEPVLVEDVRPQMRTEVIESVLDNNGYFNSKASYTVNYNKKNPKKGSITYTVDVSKPYPIDSLIYINDKDSPLACFIDSLAQRNSYLQKGAIFAVDSLASVRISIANTLRNRGYYYFRPDYIEFLADSTINPGSIALKMMLASNVPDVGLQRYKTGNVYTTVLRRSSRNPGTPDTLHTSRGEVVIMQPARVRKNLVPGCITFRKGKIFSVRDMDRTQTRLSRLGIFSSVQVQPVPVDTTGNNPMLDVYITCQLDRPMEATIEVNASSKSNSYIGPGIILSLTNHNLFGGGEKFSLSLNGDYEWQTGHGRSSVFNSYEFGLTGTLAFPRLLVPNFIRRSNRDLNWTNISLNAEVLNRPHYFRMWQFNAGISYEWRAFRHVNNQLTLFKLSYVHTTHTTAEFDSIMNSNPAIALSFRSQFIPQLSYTYTYDKFFEREKNNGINFTATFTEAGNIFSGIWRMFGVKGEKKLFGTPFSQFVKGQAQVVYSRRLIPGSDQWLVSRLLVGAAHAYGNSTQVPYSEQFYAGGANSVRAFTVRSIGPGSYRAPADLVNGYFDQTGTFKFEANCEYRFPIVSVLHGAVFLDAGNVWLLKNDPQRPGGLLTARDFWKDLALGTGVGLRVDIGMLVIRGDLGYGLHAPYFTGTNHYFNIAFRKAFAFHLAIGYPF